MIISTRRWENKFSKRSIKSKKIKSKMKTIPDLFGKMDR